MPDTFISISHTVGFLSLLYFSLFFIVFHHILGRLSFSQALWFFNCGQPKGREESYFHGGCFSLLHSGSLLWMKQRMHMENNCIHGRVRISNLSPSGPNESSLGKSFEITFSVGHIGLNIFLCGENIKVGLTSDSIEIYHTTVSFHCQPVQFPSTYLNLFFPDTDIFLRYKEKQKLSDQGSSTKCA